MAIASLLCLVLVGYFSYSMIFDAGLDWYLVLPAAFIAFGIMSAVMKAVFSLFGKKAA